MTWRWRISWDYQQLKIETFDEKKNSLSPGEIISPVSTWNVWHDVKFLITLITCRREHFDVLIKFLFSKAAASEKKLLFENWNWKFFYLKLLSFSVFGLERRLKNAAREDLCEEFRRIWMHANDNTYSNAQQSVQKLWFKFKWIRHTQKKNLSLPRWELCREPLQVQLSRIFQFPLGNLLLTNGKMSCQCNFANTQRLFYANANESKSVSTPLRWKWK